MEKFFYTISEAAEAIGESVSLVRYWSNSFPRYIKPHRNNKGNRLYRPDDLEALRKVHYLVKEKGLTLEGAARQMEADSGSVDVRVKALEALKAVREQLVEVRNSL